ncbi:hypothetical protein [Leptonema illini]|uniref:hypothetical protein n=2 Tax=Leptonema illini TaxID=183 RepID=UPI001B7FA824|nr:hypothetical protein [Leptonema illini]
MPAALQDGAMHVGNDDGQNLSVLAINDFYEFRGMHEVRFEKEKDFATLAQYEEYEKRDEFRQ